MKKKILIIVLSDVRHDARMRRQVQFLKDRYNVTLACFNAEPSSEYEVVKLPPLKLTLWTKAITSLFLLSRSFSMAHKILYSHHAFLKSEFRNRKFDMIIANDVETLPLAFAISGEAKVLFDAHEYAPRHFEDKLIWRIFFQRFNTWLCKAYIPKCAAMTTVGKGLANEYEKNFNVKPVVITNANQYFDLQATTVENDKIRLVHHGIINASRKLDLMIDLIQLLDDRFTLDLILLTPPHASKQSKAYIADFQKRVNSTPRLQMLPPVKSVDIVPMINKYDMGVFLLPPVNFNYENTLPNKLFDFIQARLGIAIGPTPEMADIVNTYNIGVVSEEFTPQSLAEKLNALTKDQVQQFKQNASRAANDHNAEHNSRILNNYIANTLS